MPWNDSNQPPRPEESGVDYALRLKPVMDEFFELDESTLLSFEQIAMHTPEDDMDAGDTYGTLNFLTFTMVYTEEDDIESVNFKLGPEEIAMLTSESAADTFEENPVQPFPHVLDVRDAALTYAYALKQTLPAINTPELGTL